MSTPWQFIVAITQLHSTYILALCAAFCFEYAPYVANIRMLLSKFRMFTLCAVHCTLLYKYTYNMQIFWLTISAALLLAYDIIGNLTGRTITYTAEEET